MIGAASLVQDISNEFESQKRLLSYYERLSDFSSKLLELSERKKISGEKLGSTIRELTQFSAQALKVDRASCWLFNQGGTSATAITCYDHRSKTHTSGDILLFEKYPAFFSALMEQRLLVADNARLDPRTREFNDTHFIEQDIYAKLAVTVRKRGVITGMICFEHGNPLRSWAPDEQLFASASAEMLSLALEERERSLEEAKSRRLEAQLFQNQKLEALGSLAGGIAHDFNNLLSAILGSVELAELRQKSSQDISAQLKTIYDAGNRAKELVQQILSFSRNAPVQNHPILVDEVIEQAVSLLRASTPSFIDIQYQSYASGKYMISNSTQIHQVLINIVTNAAHAIGDKEGAIAITSKSVSFTDLEGESPPPHVQLDKGNYIEISISDNGPGIPSELIPNIFDPFFTTKELGKGTGLGLSIVHSIVKSMNGAILVESSAKIGTTFKFYIPLGSAPTQQDDIKPTTASIHQIDGHGAKVLVVDDEQSMLNLLSDFLTVLNFKSVTFLRPDFALEEFRQNFQEYSLVITDFTMPIMTGFTFAESIKRISLSTPVILMTGNVKPKNLFSHGISSCLEKPFKVEDLASSLIPIFKKMGQNS
jgi:signal transduction histidine kinase